MTDIDNLRYTMTSHPVGDAVNELRALVALCDARVFPTLQPRVLERIAAALEDLDRRLIKLAAEALGEKL